MSAAPKLQAGEVFLNPAARTAAVTAPPRAPLGLHRRLPGYAATPLADAPALARANGVERVWVKDESARLGLPRSRCSVPAGPPTGRWPRGSGGTWSRG